MMDERVSYSEAVEQLKAVELAHSNPFRDMKYWGYTIYGEKGKRWVTQEQLDRFIERKLRDAEKAQAEVCDDAAWLAICERAERRRVMRLSVARICRKRGWKTINGKLKTENGKLEHERV